MSHAHPIDVASPHQHGTAKPCSGESLVGVCRQRTPTGVLVARQRHRLRDRAGRDRCDLHRLRRRRRTAAKVIAVESSVAFAFVVIAAAAVTGTPWLLVVGLRRPRPQGPLAAPHPLRREHALVAAVLHGRRLRRAPPIIAVEIAAGHALRLGGAADACSARFGRRRVSPTCPSASSSSSRCSGSCIVIGYALPDRRRTPGSASGRSPPSPCSYAEATRTKWSASSPP